MAASIGDEGTWWLALATDPAAADGIETSQEATGAAFRARMLLQPDDTRTLSLRLSQGGTPRPPVGIDADATLGTRAREGEAFLATLVPHTGEDLARLFWCPSPRDTSVVDRVFEAVALAVVDPVSAQRRLSAVIDEQMRSRVASTEPPIAAWAALRIHELVVSSTGGRDHEFLEQVFHVLLEDYSRWVDRLDRVGSQPAPGWPAGPRWDRQHRGQRGMDGLLQRLDAVARGRACP